MNQFINRPLVLVVLIMIAGCGSQLGHAGVDTTGKACLGSDNDSLVEGMQDQCVAGDTIATKHPAYFCDFSYSVAYNNYNSAICVYAGKQKPERTAE